MATFGPVVAVSIGHHTSPWPNGDQQPAWTKTGGYLLPDVADVVLWYAGMEATLDVQPESLRFAGEDDAGDLSFDVSIEVVGRLGSEILLDVSVGSTTMVALVEPTVSAKGRERLTGDQPSRGREFNALYWHVRSRPQRT